MAMPSTTVTRYDLSAPFSEFDQSMQNQGFIGSRVLRPRVVGVQAADIGKIPIEAMLKIKDDNRAAAERIPRVLRMAGLYVVLGSGPEDKTTTEVHEVIEQNIELLAEEEHEGWMDHRAKNGP